MKIYSKTALKLSHLAGSRNSSWILGRRSMILCSWDHRICFSRVGLFFSKQQGQKYSSIKAMVSSTPPTPQGRPERFFDATTHSCQWGRIHLTNWSNVSQSMPLNVRNCYLEISRALLNFAIRQHPPHTRPVDKVIIGNTDGFSRQIIWFLNTAVCSDINRKIWKNMG